MSMKTTKTYNQYLTEQALLQTQAGTALKHGVVAYKVRRPYEGEIVEKFTNFSDILAQQTLTSIARRDE